MTTAQDVLAGDARWSCDVGDARAWLASLPTRCASLVFFSPPYENQRTYGIGVKSRGEAWVKEMRAVVVESARVSSGLVVVNAAGPVRDRSYSPSMECLVADLVRHDGIVCGPAPWVWWKVCGIPGSGGKDYQRRDWEPLYAFCLPDRLPLMWSDNTAFGRPPVYGPGGEFSNRTKDGSRANDPWKTASRGGSGCGGRRRNGEKMAGPKKTIRQPSGRMEEVTYVPPKIANPGNMVIDDSDSSVIEARVGGRHMGHDLAHESEAPMSLMVAERLIRWYCPPSGVVCDPFVGSGTSLHAAVLHGRKGIGCDIRSSQADLVARRMASLEPVDTQEAC